MKRISYSSLAFAAFMALGLLVTGLAIADPLTCPGNTPSPNTAIVTTRVFNDCPGSELSYQNNYPTYIRIADADDGCTGTNLHVWTFSEDGITPAVFENCSHYEFSAVVALSGGYGEAGLRVSPWWSPNVDGRFMINSGGEIACFGGRLPFYSFTVAHGLHYVPGTQIWMQITYNPHGLTEADPATITYKAFYQGNVYYSPDLPFDLGNETQPEYGFWGELYPAYVGGYVQAPNWNGGAAYNMVVTWENIQFEGPTATPASNSSWGQVKTLYR